MGSPVVLALAVLAGVAIAIQGQFMGLMTQVLGARESVFITYAGGAALAVLIILTAQGGNLENWRSVPWYVFTSGIFGLVIIGTIGYVVPHLGLATGFGIIVASQFICGAIIDRLGLFNAQPYPLEWSQLVGLGLIVAGVSLMGR